MKKGILILLLAGMAVVAMGQEMDISYEDYIGPANEGNASAQFYIGLIYEQGRGVPEDEQKAIEWYHKAAEGGFTSAQKNLANRYFLGKGVKKDFKQAVYWWSKAAEEEEEMSLFMLGKCYENGLGVQKNYLESILYYQRAIDTEVLDEYDEETAKGKIEELVSVLNESGATKEQQDALQSILRYQREVDSGVLDDKDEDIAIGKIKELKSQLSVLVSQQVQQDASSDPNATGKAIPASVVDKNIFVDNTTNLNTFAVIIGNEQYKSEASVPFAENDAKIFKEYVQKTLGVPEKQIKYVSNASLNDLRIAIRWLKQAMQVSKGDGRAIFYYAGHGIPDEDDRTAYLLPTDGIGGDPESAYSLNKLYDELSKMPAQRVTIFLDACFSGTKRDGKMMASARGVAIKVKPADIDGSNLVVFTAAQGDETAYPYNDQKHGMFTFYLLKKLQDSQGNATLGELGDYIKEEVSRQSFLENNKMQTPTVCASEPLSNSWRKMKLK